MNSAVGNKIKKIMKEGVRKNTHAPVSKKNPRRKVPQKQAVAIAINMTKKGKRGLIVALVMLPVAANAQLYSNSVGSIYRSAQPTVVPMYPGARDGPQYHIQPYVAPPPVQQQPLIDRFRPGVTGIWPGDPRW